MNEATALHPTFVEEEVRVIGHRWSARVHELKNFLARSRVPYRWLDVERDDSALTTAEAAVPGVERFPVVLFPDGSVLVDPDVRAMAEKLGLESDPDARSYDLIVVGGGPAGLAASIYGSSEGLRTLIIEREVPGGQATYSASVENYPGFPEGLSGSDLTRRTVAQAERFGTEIVVTRRATRLRADGADRHVTLDNGTELTARSVLLTMGVSFRWLDAPGCPSLVGAGIYYGAATAEASACHGQEVYVLGGGNSAAQAALLLAQHARHVVILTLEDSLEQTMSKYLVERIRRTENITVRTNHTVVGAQGTGHLEWLTIQNVRTGQTERVPASGLFVFIGATPRTDWLEGSVVRDERGFILSGLDLRLDGRLRREWPLEREPYLLETSTPGVFVAGDVRKGSVKRIAAAVGEGASVIQCVHHYFRHS
jgi:thioredoxin reductase (NADPH)